MISHGTDGTDGLEAGIHLRWQFDTRLGFPPEGFGFYLYRRSSCSGTFCYDDFRDDKIVDLGLPSGTYAVEININFVSRGSVGSGGSVEIITKADEREIEAQSFSGTGSKSIRFSALGINGILIRGTNIVITEICFYVCEDCDFPWEGPINAKCGFGLPIKIPKIELDQEEEGRTTNENEVERKMQDSPGTPPITDPEWEIAACRLPRDKWSQFQGKPFQDLKEILALMVKDANDAPMGWRIINYKGDGYPDTWINWVRATPRGVNIANGGSTSSSTVIVDFQGTVAGRGSHIDLRIDNGPYTPVASPHTITGLSVGKHMIYLKAINQQREEDPTPAEWTFTVKKGKDGGGYPDTWINWVRTPEGKNILDGGTTTSTKVIVDFQGTVAGRGSHIDLKIDDDKYKPVASPHTITRLSEGAHTIYLRAVDQDGNVDPTPAKWTFTVKKDKSESAMAATAPAITAEEEETSPEFQISPMDLILIASTNPYIARILGLYWVDTTAENGKVYDYKIVANWPAGTLWNLENVVDFEKEIAGKKFFYIFRHENFVFFNMGVGTVESVPSTFAQAKNGLHISLWSNATDSIKIHCTNPIKELQLFVKHQGPSVTLVAFHNNNQVDSSTLAKPEGVLTVHYPQNIDYVILRSKDVIIYKICWDAEYIPHGERSFTLCGAEKGVPLPADIPTGLKVFPLPGMTKIRNDNNSSLEDHRFAAGLIWDIPKFAEERFDNKAAIMYHVQRRTPRGDIEWLTENSPVEVIPESFEETPLWPKGWPEQQMFYVDVTSSPGTYNYRISAVDIFGRISQYTNWVSVDLRTTVPPPPPSDIEAKLLDPSDPSLTGDERAWVTANNNKRIGLKVRWKWIEPLRRQAPDVKAFKIYFQPGWLNVVQGKIEEDPVENQSGMLELKTSYISNITPVVPENVFAEEKMLMNLTNYNIESSKRDGTTTSGKFIFTIRKPIPRAGDYASSDFGTFRIVNEAEIRGSNSNNNLEITTDYQIPMQASTESFIGQTLTIRQKQYRILSCRKDGAGYAVFTIPKIYPRKNDFFSIPISQQKEPQEGGTFIDYRKASSWQQTLHTEPLIQISKEQYEIIIPNPPLGADRDNKVVYAQIGISSVNVEGEGSVSSPASIIAVFREPPPPQRLQDTPNTYATVPNYYGKSSYALRWPKPATNDIRYFVYRAMDESLFLVDKEIRSAIDASGNPLRSRDPVNYAEFLNNFDAAHRSEIIDKVIRPVIVDYNALASDPLKNTFLKALASLPGNEYAFARLHVQAIDPSDGRFANRNTDVPPPGQPDPTPDPGLLLYVDDTIDGHASNVYFYRIRTANEIGTLGRFGFSTFPVLLPKATPPISPRIIAIEGGDRQITIKWSSYSVSKIVGYLVYRTTRANETRDVRKMQLLKLNLADSYSVAVEDQSAPEFEYVDTSVDAMKEYLYGIVAVDEKSLRSRVSELRSGMAYDNRPPSEPTWLRSEWVKLADDGHEHSWTENISDFKPAVALAFSTNQAEISVLIKHLDINGNYRSIGPWITNSHYGSTANLWEFKAYDMKANPTSEQRYRLRLISRSGAVLESTQERVVGVP